MEVKEFVLGRIKVQYLISEEGRASMLLLPVETRAKEAKNWELGPGKWDVRGEYIREWRQGTLVQLHLRHHNRSRGNGMTMKNSQSMELLKFHKQWTEEDQGQTKICTLLKAQEGYQVLHILGYEEGVGALWCETSFLNLSEETYELEMLSSFCMDDLSPYQADNDQTEKLAFHRFYGSWALEGRHVCQSIEDLGLQKSWCSPFIKGERFGTIGSWTTHRYFPVAALEDRENQIIWAAALETVSSWQMELTRDGDTLSFSGGLADVEQGAWMKRVAPGEQFVAPRARLTVVEGDIQDACQRLLELQNLAVAKYGEQGMPVTFNEYCSSWGNPTQEKELEYAKILKDKGVGYFVIDAGWSRGSHEQWGNGEWILDTDRFPNLKEMNRELRKMGMIPGIWFEFEATTDGSHVFAKEYDVLHLQREGQVIHFGADRSFWDFRKKEVREYLRERVIDFLKEYDFGYMKVDYNGNIGLGCDGAESLGEGLRQQMEAVREFFLEIKKELPELIVENCASGGHRMEPAMMSVTGMSSFSDCHEAREIPYIAGNLQNLCVPKQNLIWAVLRQDDAKERLEYSVSAGFLGRLCFSGDIEQLTREQWKVVTDGLELYRQAESVLQNGVTRVYRTKEQVIRHPQGLQAVVRKNDKEMLVVVHAFEGPEEDLLLPMEDGMTLAGSYGSVFYELCPEGLRISHTKDWTAGVLYFQKK